MPSTFEKLHRRNRKAMASLAGSTVIDHPPQSRYPRDPVGYARTSSASL